MKLEDFKPGDLLEITSRGKRGEEVRAAYVTLVNYNGCGCVTYAGRSVEGMMATGQGAFDPTQVGTTYYGLVVAVKISWSRSRSLGIRHPVVPHSGSPVLVTWAMTSCAERRLSLPKGDSNNG